LEKKIMVYATESKLKPIGETPSLQELAYQAIKSSILSLSLPPGKQFSESELAESLKVSKTPVREAIQRLEREGLVRIEPRRGAFVTELSEEVISEISEIRSVLVGLASKRAAKNANEKDILVARGILKAGDEALRKGDNVKWILINEEFHAWLINLANSKQLSQVLEILDQHFTRIQSLATSVPGEIIESNIEHYAILDAIAAKDPIVASKAATDHVLHVGEQAINFYHEFKSKLS
jgi:DNA-binding GntR family transcriptional regulator